MPPPVLNVEFTLAPLIVRPSRVTLAAETLTTWLADEPALRMVACAAGLRCERRVSVAANPP